jgi:hypothetical protein
VTVFRLPSEWPATRGRPVVGREIEQLDRRAALRDALAAVPRPIVERHLAAQHHVDEQGGEYLVVIDPISNAVPHRLSSTAARAAVRDQLVWGRRDMVAQP